MSHAVWRSISVFGTVHRLARVPLAIAFAVIWAALLLSSPWSLAHAEDATPSVSSVPFEIEHKLASKPLESALPCHANAPLAAYHVQNADGSRVVLLCENGRYSAYLSASDKSKGAKP